MFASFWIAMLIRGKYYEVFEKSFSEYCWFSASGAALLIVNELK